MSINNNTTKLVLIGGGGHCKSVLDTILRINFYDDIVITDPNIKPGTEILGKKVVGSDDCLEKLFNNGYKDAFITVGQVMTSDIRQRLWENASSIGFNFPAICDPSAVVSPSAIISQGVYIGKNTVINAEVVLSENCIINNGAIIEHDAKIGCFTHIAVGAIICGEVIIGDNTLIGAGSTIIQCLNVGNSSIIGAGSTVIRNIGNNEKVYGIVK